MIVIGASYGTLFFLFTTDYNDDNISIAIKCWWQVVITGLIIMCLIDGARVSIKYIRNIQYHKKLKYYQLSSLIHNLKKILSIVSKR